MISPFYILSISCSNNIPLVNWFVVMFLFRFTLVRIKDEAKEEAEDPCRILVLLMTFMRKTFDLLFCKFGKEMHLMPMFKIMMCLYALMHISSFWVWRYKKAWPYTFWFTFILLKPQFCLFINFVLLFY